MTTLTRLDALALVDDPGAMADRSDAYVAEYALAALDDDQQRFDAEEQERDELGRFGSGGATARDHAQRLGAEAKAALARSRAAPDSREHAERHVALAGAAKAARASARRAESASTPEEAARHTAAAERHASILDAPPVAAAPPALAKSKTGFSKGDKVLVDGESATVLHGERRSGDQLLVRGARDSGAKLVPLKSVEPHVAAAAHGDQHLADVVHAAAASATGEHQRFGDRKVFSHEVYNSMSAADRAKFGTVDQFKDKLRELGRAGHVRLGRADLVQAMNSSQVAKSHVNMDGGAHVDDSTPHAHTNFVEDRSIGGARPAAPTADHDAARASKTARSATDAARRSADHVDAAAAHAAASEAHARVGSTKLSELHKLAADAHTNAASEGVKTGVQGSRLAYDKALHNAQMYSKATEERDAPMARVGSIGAKRPR